ncbi:MAG: TM2 domain-containing protein, partial [Bacteroidota bacterium]
YRSRRKDPQTILLVTLVGFLGIAGIQRFLTDQIGLGILYLLTCGICMIGTIIDLVNYKKIAFEYNQQQANQIAVMLKGM